MNVKRGAVVLCAMICAVLLTADTFKAKKAKHFDRVLRKHSMVVVLFYKENKEIKKDRALARRINTLERSFKRVAEQDRYEDAKVAFMRANITQQSLEDIAIEYGVTTLPTILLFQNGSPVEGAVLTGFVNEQQLRSFVDSYFGDTINMHLEQRAERKRQRAENRRSYTHFGYGYGYGYPYGGYYGYPYGGGGASFGFTF